MHLKEYFNNLKSQDIKNRRKQGIKPTCFHDIVCAQYFKIEGNTRKFMAYYSSEFEQNPTVLCDDVDFVGKMYIAPKSKLRITVNKNGLQFDSYIKTSLITIYGTKSPYKKG